MTMPTITTVFKAEPSIFWPISSGEKEGLRISTGIGFSSLGWTFAGGGGAGVSSSVKLRTNRVARVMKPLPEVRNACNFTRTFCSYSGILRAKSPACEAIKLLTTKTTSKENRTTTVVAGTRPKPQRRRRTTSGPNRKASSTANASGMKTTRAK